MECGGNIMHTSEVSHVKSVEEFYKSIREQQEEAHGKEYCDQHDAIVKYMAECDSYKELGTHQGATAACAMLLKPKYVELVDINHYKYRWKLQELAEPFCQENNIELVVKEVDSSSLADGALLQYSASSSKWVARNELDTDAGTIRLNAGSF